MYGDNVRAGRCGRRQVMNAPNGIKMIAHPEQSLIRTLLLGNDPINASLKLIVMRRSRSGLSIMLLLLHDDTRFKELT
jgi:hypothetical protein